jgi:transcriptional regulator with PAS, ATPase and Fis domain
MKRASTGNLGFDPWRCSLEDFQSADPGMARCLELARVASQTELPILILGESGTGKTLLARAIHNSSRRAEGPFVSFSGAALSETLLDSQLFGHERGAFTGAQQRLKGKFELADGGTLFIDEIADMSPLAQAKVLRAVEYGEFERLGSERLQVADVRLLSATHFPLRRFLDSDQFRKDLFYRINGLTLTIAPLRDRPRDLRSLVAAKINVSAGRQGKTITGLSTEAADMLFNYHWPGNLRELDRVIHAAVAVTTGSVIGAEAVMLDGRWMADAPAHPTRGDGAATVDDSDLRMMERRHIRRVLDKLGGNKARTARALGISRSTLDRKLAGGVSS